MKSYFESITADSISGILFALEGVANSLVLLNGPTGCKFYHSSVSDSQVIRPADFEKYNYGMQWFFGQARVPCTYLDNSDYVYGSTEKIEAALADFARELRFDLLAVVNSPGAALIGDDLAGIARRVCPACPVITIQTPGFSDDICRGHETAACALLQALRPEMTKEKPPAQSEAPAVNLLGLSIYHRNIDGDKAELARLLELCGVRVNTFFLAGSSMDELLRLPAADLNVVIHPETGHASALWLEREFGMPSLVCKGPPIGFAATEELLGDVCRRVGADPAPALLAIERDRARAYAFLSRVHAVSGLPRGATFSVEGTYAELYACISFLTEYLGMVPVAASVRSASCTQSRAALNELLEDLHALPILSRSIEETPADLVFASGNTIARCKIRGHIGAGVEISLPGLGYYDVTPKTLLGARGALQLVEFVLNGLHYAS